MTECIPTHILSISVNPCKVRTKRFNRAEQAIIFHSNCALLYCVNV